MGMVNTLRKEICDMNVMELIEKISEIKKIVAINLWVTNRECINVAFNECLQKMKGIQLLADKSKLKDAIGNIRIALSATKISRNVKGIDDDYEELTSDSEYHSVSSYTSESD